MQTLEQEFGFPIKTIKEIGEARRTHDLYANGFGSKDVYQKSPICKHDVYTKHGLTFAQGEAISWAYIWQGAD